LPKNGENHPSFGVVFSGVISLDSEWLW